MLYECMIFPVLHDRPKSNLLWMSENLFLSAVYILEVPSNL